MGHKLLKKHPQRMKKQGPIIYLPRDPDESPVPLLEAQNHPSPIVPHTPQQLQEAWHLLIEALDEASRLAPGDPGRIGIADSPYGYGVHLKRKGEATAAYIVTTETLEHIKRLGHEVPRLLAGF
jgi:hypothetical protein